LRILVVPSYVTNDVTPRDGNVRWPRLLCGGRPRNDRRQAEWRLWRETDAYVGRVRAVVTGFASYYVTNDVTPSAMAATATADNGETSAQVLVLLGDWAKDDQNDDDDDEDARENCSGPEASGPAAGTKVLRLVSRDVVRFDTWLVAAESASATPGTLRCSETHTYISPIR